MKKKFVSYLKSIGLADGIIKRVETIHEFFGKISKDEVSDIFITDYIKEDGSREYQNLWFFTKNHCMEAKGFITDDVFDSTPMKNRLVRWELRKQDYDFEKGSETSRLFIDIRFEQRIAGMLKASRENCDYLRDIFKKYIVPNLIV